MTLHYSDTMKKFAAFITVLLGLCSFEMHSQTIAVESFTLSQTDMTANLEGTSVRDQNGEVCALIKIETTQKGFTFDVGVLGVVRVVEHPAEIWVYVPFGIRKITIQHPQLGMLRDYQIPCSIERGRTYVMKITAGSVRTIVEHAVTHQFLYMELDPADAMLEIGGKIKATNDGVYQELVQFGRYDYRAHRMNYHDAVGTVTVSDPDNTTRVKVKLKPAFGHLSVLAGSQSDITGAAVYIDDKPAGEIPIRNMQLSSGTHQIRVIKPMYEIYNGTFTIVDEENKTITPALVADFAEVTVKTNQGAVIYINGEEKGKGSWKGRLSTGSYVFEGRQQGHITSRMPYDITRADQYKVITIPDPTPIYGSLVISSTPSNARITIDDKYIGETPRFIGRQVIGEYSVKVELSGYASQTKKVTVSEGNQSALSFELEKSTSANNTTYSSTASSGVTSSAGTPGSGTANCYIITKPGSYRFATVKGNSNISVGNVASAAVLWETFNSVYAPAVGDLISSVSYSNGYITFSTPSAYKEGNALIAAKDAYGNILWSWHIWFTDMPKGQVYYNNAGTMMDRNLGAISASPGDYQSLGLLYQWGRKDPFLGSATIDNYGTEPKSTTTWPAGVESSRSTGTIEYATSHPTTFIKLNDKNEDWYYTGGSTTDRTRWTTSDKPKSIYDPCPAGWRVPDGGKNGVWHKAVGTDQSSYKRSPSGQGTNMGGFFGSDSSIWYPFAGYRDKKYTTLFRAAGYYWSATNDASTSSDYINDAYVLINNDYEGGKVYTKYNSKERAEGCSVRCIKE